MNKLMRNFAFFSIHGIRRYFCSLIIILTFPIFEFLKNVLSCNKDKTKVHFN